MARRDRRGRERAGVRPPPRERRGPGRAARHRRLARMSPDEVLRRFRAARAEGAEASEVIPTLFPEPPRFPHPDVARRLFQNLLGLWDAVGLACVPSRLGAARRAAPAGEGAGTGSGRTDGPDRAYVEAVRAWLATDRRARDRLADSFENRQDALLGSLDERGLSDEGWGVLRQLAFELHAVLEHADGAAPASVPPEALEGDPAAKAPVELIGLVDQALAPAEQDGPGPVPPAERETIRTLGRQVLGALWEARARR